MKSSTSTVFGSAILGIFFLISILGSWGCREATINACEDRGGQVVSHPWWSEAFWSPGCVEEKP